MGGDIMRDEILQSIDNIIIEEDISFFDVSNAISNYYEKQNIILENCDDYDSYLFPDQSFIQESEGPTKGDTQQTKTPGILSKIWNAIKQFFKMIADAVRRLIDKITGQDNSVGNKKHTNCDSIVLKVLSKSEFNVPDNTELWSIPKINSKYSVNQEDDMAESMDGTNNSGGIVTESYVSNNNRYITIKIPAGRGSVFFPKELRVPNNDIVAAINDEDKTITFHQAGYGKFDKTKGTINNSNEITAEITETKKPWSHSSKTALCLLQDQKVLDKLVALTNYAADVLFKDTKYHKKFNSICKSVINDIEHSEKKIRFHKVRVSLKELGDFQKKINSLIYKIDEFSNIETDVSSLDKETIGCFNDLYKKLLDIQISMNLVTSSFNTPLIINAHYIGCIKSMTLLDEFVNTMINEGIPPKYIAYNTWLVADECIRGSGDDYDPIWGQTRFTFFPPNKNLVYKIAMSGAGITSNRAEIRTSEMFQKMGRVDLIAPVVKHWNNDAIVVMERIHSSGTPSYATCLAYTKRCNDAIMEYEKTHKVKLNIRIADQHKDNVMYDKKNKCYRSIDYGIATRAYVKEPKKDKKKK
jgi:hypothetical protein